MFIKKKPKWPFGKKEKAEHENGDSTQKSSGTAETSFPDKSKRDLLIEDLGLGKVKTVDVDTKSVTGHTFEEEGVIYMRKYQLMGRTEHEITPIKQNLLSGNIALIDLQNFLEINPDPREIERLIDRLRGVAKEVGGEIVQIGDYPYIIITPKNVKIDVDEELF
ncbi:MAG: cell division protein SepF [Candidatus Odinarchaeota archaeon]|nr:cell division protein SepF [Candidatus Odinarchaeota archaeon]